jgi:hypothetical protein
MRFSVWARVDTGVGAFFGSFVRAAIAEPTRLYPDAVLDVTENVGQAIVGPEN